MSRFGVFWFILVILSGATNFLVKQRVQSLDDELNRARRQTVEEQKKIHDLTAEWTFLNQPELLADLNTRYLHLVPVSPKQVQTSIDGLPMRPIAPPPQAAPQLAAASDAAPAADPAGVPLDPPSASANPPAAPPRAPIVTVSAPAPAPPPPTITAAATPPARSPSPPQARPATLDALFAQVAGNH